MRKLSLIAISALLLASCGGRYAGVPAEYYDLLDQAFEKAGENRNNLRAALKEAPRGQREGMAFLIVFMPDKDLVSIDKRLLLDNVDYAYRARDEFAWTAALPKDIFLNEVLPYASVDEKRENWRPAFYDIFSKRVANAPDIRAAIEAVNRNIAADVRVDYNTAREKTNQSPSESMRQNMASCTGLSILLVDALRSVGIPARFAGTPGWHDDRGNHSWVEVWIDGRWYFTEYYPEALDRAWFLADAGKADPHDRAHSIYATSYKPTGDRFPMVWNPEEAGVPGVNVSERYIQVWRQLSDARLQAGTHVPVTFMMYKSKSSSSRSADRVAANVDVFRGTDQMGGGRTAGPLQDMNDVLVFDLPKGGTYTFRYAGAAGEPMEVSVTTGDKPVTVKAYME